ncbi:MAG: Macrolide export ATP-binding/permease protein MacB [Chloroflexi bacterium ADurb.Bin180]|nr:MAG: Macrolide export ATP-binding/permease protein MacB [Chloroflexi bacterium ADurb.Bin180]
MSLLESLRVAASGLATNKMRAILTMLGIIIGVAAVVALLSLGQGVRASVTGQIESIGSNLVYITAYRDDSATRLSYVTAEDADSLADPLYAPALRSVAAAAQGALRVSFGDQGQSLTVVGTSAEYAVVRNLEAVLGGFLTRADQSDSARVAVLGGQAYADLFAEGDYPVGQSISIDGVAFEVVGVLKEQGGLTSDDSSVFIPLSTAQARFFTQRTLSGEHPVQVIYASMVDGTVAQSAEEQIREVLRERHSLDPDAADDFRISTQQAILDVVDQITSLLTVFLAAIGGISLLVGGIGIMNIMLVSVTERTREIGIRKSVGATSENILAQFLLEAVLLSLSGGIIGILLGQVGALVISGLVSGLKVVVSVGVVALAAGVACGIGLIFGTYPALAAARLNPIDALRHE